MYTMPLDLISETQSGKIGFADGMSSCAEITKGL